MTTSEHTGKDIVPNADTATPALAAALDQLWLRFVPEIRKRVDTLESAAVACSAQALSAELRELAHAAAHKLAGTLGTFNLANGTELARECELLLENDADPHCMLAERLAANASEIRSIVDNRGLSPLSQAESAAVPKLV